MSTNRRSRTRNVRFYVLILSVVFMLILSDREQEVWAHLAVHHCLTRIIMRLAARERIDPDRISFVKVLKHVRRSVIRQSALTSAQIRQFTVMLTAKVRRKLDNGARRLREKQAGASSARPRSTPSVRQARSAVLPAGWPPRCSRSIQR